MRKIAIVAAAFVLCSSPSMAAEKEVSLAVKPGTSFAFNGNRNHIGVLIRIERHQDNRLIRLEWDSPDGEAGSSQKSIEGENSQTVFTGEDFLGRFGLCLPAGHYQIRVTVFRIVEGEEKKHFAQTEAKILRAEGEEL